MVHRFSSRSNNLGDTFFKNSLRDAVSYDRIAGYFSSSIIEIAGEYIEQMKGTVRIICNSHLQADDIKYIKDQSQAMKLEWCEAKPEEKFSKIHNRLQRLYKFITTGKVQVRVLPDEVFGLIHGKAGIITKSDNRKIAFIGSMNETYHGWGKGGNYEIAWVDEDESAINWVQKEFNELWEHPLARPLSKFIVDDIKRISERKVIYEITEWLESDVPAATVIESPVYRKEFGLWEHQKYFVDLAYRAHKSGLGARYVLADMVGLGKTIQLALSAMLMALHGRKPILVIVPKPLLWQWQEELLNLLDMPSAVWDGKCWVDENEVEYPAKDEFDLGKCPRRIGIISQGLIVRSRSRISDQLLKQNYECVIVDEAHRARRKNTIFGKENDLPDPNNLMAFLLDISRKTKSMLLATATPVQIHPIEAWDLLLILSQGNNFVLGNDLSRWRSDPARALKLLTGREEITNESELWDWIRNPFPPSEERPNTIGVFRRLMDMSSTDFVISGSDFHTLNSRQLAKLNEIFADNYILNHNPFIRHIIRRERKFLEETINPDTNQPYLKPIKVSLYGEGDNEHLTLSTHLSDAYNLAETFSQLLTQRVKSGGFVRTILLRRICSSMYAGLLTGMSILQNWNNNYEYEDDDYGEVEENNEIIANDSPFKNLTREETECIEGLVNILEEHHQKDPKYELLRSILTGTLTGRPWLDEGCIVFSQYYDTVKWIADRFAKEFPDYSFGLYAGSNKSGVYEKGIYYRRSKEDIKQMVRSRHIKLLFGTDAASEGLNLQALGTLINLDLPWNPTRLEQRKGRIQRIGQEREDIAIYNMRYRNSVEDRVHQLLADRLKNIKDLFGQIPDTLEDVWVEVALNKIADASRRISDFSENNIHPFYNKYQNQASVKPINWEDCSLVLDNYEKRKHLLQGW